MFFILKVNLEGLDFYFKYIFLIDIVFVDDCCYKYYNLEWVVIGKVELYMFGCFYIYFDFLVFGFYWMK